MGYEWSHNQTNSWAMKGCTIKPIQNWAIKGHTIKQIHVP